MNIKKVVDDSLVEMAQAIEKFPWENKEHYAWFLAQTYFYVRRSTRLFAASAARFGLEQDSLHLLFAKQLGEEARHELLAVNDLKNLGLSINDYSELPETRAWYHSQFYYVQNEDASGFLGAMLCLEALAVKCGPALLEKLNGIYGKKAASFLRVHSAEDVKHIEQDYSIFEQLRPEQQEVVLDSLSQAAWGYSRILYGINERLGANKASQLTRVS